MQKSEQIIKKFTNKWEISDYQILTDDGFVDVVNLYQTIPYEEYVIKTSSKELKCADKHIIFRDNFEEAFVDELIKGDKIITCDGIEEIVSIENTQHKEEMYDFELCEESKHRYYTNGILSHNTYMLRMLAKYLNIPFYISDASGLTQAGYVGDDVENCVLGALRDCNFNVQAAQHAIIVLDEFDKLSRKGESTSITRDVGGEGVQQSLLKLVEGHKVQVPPNGGRKHPEQECIEVDTTNILFFGIGAFEGLDKIIERRKNKKTIGFNSVMNNDNADNEEEDLFSDITTEDLKKFGLIPELIGRFPLVTHVKPLTEEEMYQVLTEPKNSIIKQYQKMMWIDNIDLIFEEKALRLIAKNASEKKTGARALRGVIDKVLAELMFEYGGYNEKKIKLVVTEEMVNKYVENKEILGKKVA